MKFIVAISCLFFAACASAALLSHAEFQNCVSAFGRGTPSWNVANAFITQAQAKGGINTKREALIAVAQMAWESLGFTAKSEVACSGGRWSKWPCESYDRNGCPPGKWYYGRGYIQLTHCYNYKAAANDLKDQRIVNDPDIVARDENLAMATALWYWKTKVHTVAQVQQGSFGAATKAINGPLECNGPHKNVAKQRWNKFNECLKKAKITNLGAWEGGCYN